MVFRARSFYAVHRIIRSDPSTLQLVNGNTLHGVQNLAPAARRTPLGYYSRGGPIGDVMRLRAQRPDRLPVGVVEVSGDLQRGSVVGVVDANGREVARGLVNYSAEETRKIMRKPTSEIEAILGYADEPELIHRDNLVLLS